MFPGASCRGEGSQCVKSSPGSRLLQPAAIGAMVKATKLSTPAMESIARDGAAGKRAVADELVYTSGCAVRGIGTKGSGLVKLTGEQYKAPRLGNLERP